MTDDPDEARVVDPNQPDAPPYRPFPDRPLGMYVQRVADHIAKTGQPETFDGLYRGRIDRAAQFRILRKVTVDRRKRPLGDMAPCPRCGCDDKFLEGRIAWFPQLQFCAVIGHCCASKEARADADREFKQRTKLEEQETYLLTAIPLLPQKRSMLVDLRGPADQARTLFRQFRRLSPDVHKHLRDLKYQRGGQLRLIEILRSAEDEKEGDNYEGPTGFRGRGSGAVETRDIELGYMRGQIAVSNNYDPIKELEETVRRLDWFGADLDDAQIIDLIISMDERHRGAVVANLQGVEKGYQKVVKHLSEFWSFFERDNIERLNAYGTHPENAFRFSATYHNSNGRTQVTIEHRRKPCRLSFADRFASFSVPWIDVE